MALKIMGIDPGLRTTGYSVLSYNGGRSKILEAGIFKTNSKDDFEIRLKDIYNYINDIIKEFKPDALSVEKLYSHYKHPQTAVVMGHARGMIFLCAAEHEIPIKSYAATKIKKSLTGNGRASKLQVQKSVQSIMKMTKLPEPPDVADAIAAALCHIEAIR